jgi:hypothetical protein
MKSTPDIALEWRRFAEFSAERLYELFPAGDLRRRAALALSRPRRP